MKGGAHFRENRAGLLAALAVAMVLLSTLPASAAEVQWLKGFPQRVGNDIVLMWLPMVGAESYSLTRTDAETSETAVFTIKGNVYVDSRTKPTKSYSYTLLALTADGRPLAASQPFYIQGKREVEPPELTGAYQEGNSVYIIWKGDERAIYHNVYRGVLGEKPRPLASVRNTQYVDKDVKPGVTYEYTVRSVDEAGKETAEAKPLPVFVAVSALDKEPEAESRVLQTINVIRSVGGKPLYEPTDMVFVRGLLYVTETDSKSVLVVNPSGEQKGRLAVMPPDYAGVWGVPWGIDATERGALFALTFHGSPNVRIFAANGKMRLDIPILRPKELENHPLEPQPMDVLFDADGGLWITEYTYGQVVHLDRDGKEIGRIGVPRQLDNPGPFRTPTFLARDTEFGGILVVDSLAGKVYPVDVDGKIGSPWERKGVEKGALFLPKGIFMTSQGEVLLVDGMLSSLQAFGARGRLKAVYHSPDLEYLNLPYIVAVTLDAETGDIYLSSKIESAIYRLQVVTQP